ncbi:unnamed protein product [Alternaria alternata]
METTTAETPKLERRSSAPVKRRQLPTIDDHQPQPRGRRFHGTFRSREEAAAGGSPQTPNGISSYYERPGVMAEMDEDVWSQSEATPVVQHFPAGKGGLPAGDSQALNPGTTFDPPVNHMMIDPLLLGSNAAYPTMHAEMPREELMYAMNGLVCLIPPDPALLSSMLWVAAQTSEASYLTSSPSARAIISQKLWKLTVDLLKPLVHSPSSHGFAPGPGLTSAAHDAFGVDRAIGRYDGRPDGAMPPTSTLDDVATYINLGVVTSASEYKAASLRWWNAAWSLARELKLGRELPQGPVKERETTATDGEIEVSMSDCSSAQAPVGTPAAAVVEEMKEERRRLWWLLYMVDRHLGLCYNRPLAMLDNECEDLFQPVPDTLWQAGEFYTGHPGARKRGLNFECTSHDIFGFFLPLMTILGDIVDLNAQKNHPRFGQRTSWELHEAEITRQLERYAYSIEDFKAQHGCGSNEEAQSNSTPDPVRSEWIHQTRKVAAYATHIMHVLHILLHGKWDPVALLEDDNMWICSQSFLAATSNAISAAHAVEVILDVDPDLSFMPYLFGMYLLQGSLILLLLADKLSTETNDGVIRACETIVRAHEAAVVTLNTEYQRNFRKVMISTLAQIKGHGHAREMTPAKRREVLSLYRWTSLGNGLAI